MNIKHKATTLKDLDARAQVVLPSLPALLPIPAGEFLRDYGPLLLVTLQLLKCTEQHTAKMCRVTARSRK